MPLSSAATFYLDCGIPFALLYLANLFAIVDNGDDIIYVVTVLRVKNGKNREI